MGRGFGGRGGFGGLGDVAKLMKQAQKMQEEMQAMRQELAEARVEATSGGGAVHAVVSGEGKLLDLRIRPDAVDPEDVEMLQDLILTAVREAEEKAAALAKERMDRVTGGMNLPDLGL
ncbi:MAG: YbaB/EbfC family nucleoid-associated protein [Chthonomonadales bacterium]